MKLIFIMFSVFFSIALSAQTLAGIGQVEITESVVLISPLGKSQKYQIDFSELPNAQEITSKLIDGGLYNFSGDVDGNKIVMKIFFHDKSE